MARQRSDADNLRAGLFVLVALVAALAVVLILAGVGDKLKRRTRYLVYFPLQTSTEGLEIDAGVLVNGRPVGVVDSIHLELDPANDKPDGVYVQILVDRAIQFYGEPTAYLNRPLLGAGATLNFPTIGDVGTAPLAPPRSVFRGAIAPPSFLAQAGYGPDQQQQVHDILARGSQFADQLEAMVREFRETTYPQINQLVADTKTRLGGWYDTGDHIVANLDEAAGRFPRIAQVIEENVENVTTIVSDAQSILDENRPGIRATVDNAKAASERFNDLVASLRDNTQPALNAMLRDGSATMDSARKAVERADALLASSSPSLQRTVANARLASDQLKFTLEEVRRSPWRLLYRPDTRELEFELLYDSARVYAQAVSDLRDASASFEAATREASAAGAPLTPSQTEEFNAQLERALGSYKEAERAFLDLIIARDGETPKR